MTFLILNRAEIERRTARFGFGSVSRANVVQIRESDGTRVPSAVTYEHR
jgi:hypothetical protein